MRGREKRRKNEGRSKEKTGTEAGERLHKVKQRKRKGNCSDARGKRL